MLNTPILFLVFNRLDTTKQVFAKIREAKPKQLFIGADGAREGKEGEAEKVAAVRKYILDNIDWDCEVKTLFREQNLGCGKAVSEAITWFFDHVEQGIILEDDTLPDLSFFPFCEELLERYKDNERVMMISGTNYLFDKTNNYAFDYYYSNICAIWGWATWRQSWQLYIQNNNYQFLEINLLEKKYSNKYFSNGMKKMLESAIKGHLDTWDIQWFYIFTKHDGLCVTSINNIITNIGVSGTHTSKQKSPFLNMPLKTLLMNKNWNYPKTLKANLYLDKIAMKHIVKGDQMKSSLYQSIRYYFNKLKKNNRYMLIKIIKKSISFFAKKRQKFIKNIFKKQFHKKVLMSHLTRPFIHKADFKHTNHYEGILIAEILNKLNYQVDVVDYNFSNSQIPFEQYDLIIGFGFPLEESFYKINRKKTKTIYYGTGNHHCFINKESIKRLKEVENKTMKLMIQSIRFSEYTWSLQTSISDGLILLGNQHTQNTYKQYYFGNHIYTLPIFFHSVINFREIESSKNFYEAKKNFLWFGSNGLIHKGLDILIEVFSRRNDINLHICGANTWEQSFFEYYKEIIDNAPNIYNHGFVNIQSHLFFQLMNTCCFIIFPSASEGGAASVVTAMGNGGLIPLISKACSLDVEHLGIVFENNSEETLKGVIEQAVQIPVNELKEKSKKVYEELNQTYTKENYKKNIENYLIKILS